MGNAILVQNIVEGNGKTVRENNVEKIHKIPLYSLVEIQIGQWDDEEDPVNGLRLYVVSHTRDCDGTPLYGLSYSKNAKKELEKYENEKKSIVDRREMELCNLIIWQCQGKITGGYSEDSLVLIE